MTFFKVGKKGGGKTLKTVQDLIKVMLERPEIAMATNISLNLPDVHQYLISHGCPHGTRRIRILTDSEVRDFWRHRMVNRAGVWLNHDVDVKCIREKAGDGKNGFWDRWEADWQAPMIFGIDEFQFYFRARECQTTSAESGWYMLQERKICTVGDWIYLITQNTKNCDPIFIRASNDFEQLRNFAYECRGRFRPPRRFKSSLYLEPPTPMSRPEHTFTFKLPEDIAKLYKSDAGAGITGKGGTELQRKTGLHWSIAIIGLLLLGLGLVMGPYLAGMAIDKAIATGKPASRTPPVAVAPVLRSPAPVVHGERPAGILVVGLAGIPGGGYRVALSDGTSRDLDGKLENGALVSGAWVFRPGTSPKPVGGLN